jgi:hypothetical protein
MLSSEENPSISFTEDGACYRIPSLRKSPVASKLSEKTWGDHTLFQTKMTVTKPKQRREKKSLPQESSLGRGKRVDNGGNGRGQSSQSARATVAEVAKVGCNEKGFGEVYFQHLTRS